LDDATRYNTGARLYPSETLPAHFDFLTRVFKTHGLPLALYVDFHSFFYTHTRDPSHRLRTASRKKQDALGKLPERVLAGVQHPANLLLKRGNPLGIAGINLPWEVDEIP
jgi:hypothetical protein